MEDELRGKEALLRMTGNLLSAILEGLGGVDPETRSRVMEACGEACAREKFWGPAIDIARRIAEEETDLDRILERANSELLWCGKWARENDAIMCTCTECGCLLVNQGVVKMNATLCLCSRGWVKTIFETLLGKPVRVDLEKSMGRGDDVCRYVVYA
jgi:predicted hydrocarbon binding protein